METSEREPGVMVHTSSPTSPDAEAVRACIKKGGGEGEEGEREEEEGEEGEEEEEEKEKEGEHKKMAREMVQLVKCLLMKHGDPSLIIRIHAKTRLLPASVHVQVQMLAYSYTDINTYTHK